MISGPGPDAIRARSAEPPDVHEADVGGGDGVVRVREIRGLERRERLRDLVVSSAVERAPEQGIRAFRRRRARRRFRLFRRRPDGEGAAAAGQDEQRHPRSENRPRPHRQP